MDESLKQKLSGYKPSDSAIALIKSTPILMLVGPTGAGKDALKAALLDTGDYHHIVSHTTRPPRINHGILETNGEDYHFIDLAQAEVMLDQQAFVEAKMYSGNVYGTSVSEIQLAHDEHKVATTDIEVQGVAEYKAFDDGVMAIFLLPPDFKTWQERLARRYGDVVDAVDFQRRLHTALDEIEQLLTTDYYIPLINDDLQVALSEVQAIVTSHADTYGREAKAHKVAEQLAIDIKAHLATV